jgi:predicted nucleic acid-binding protein
VKRAVVDASIVVDLLIEPPGGGINLGAGYGSLHAPSHLDIECLSTLRGHYLARRLNLADATTTARLVAEMPISRHDVTALVDRIMALAPNAAAYDAAYIALAEALDADLLTRDAQLARVPGIDCPVRVL